MFLSMERLWFVKKLKKQICFGIPDYEDTHKPKTI